MANLRFVGPGTTRKFVAQEDRLMLAEARRNKMMAKSRATKERVIGRKYGAGEKPESWRVINARQMDELWAKTRTCRICKKTIEDKRDAYAGTWGLSHLMCDVLRRDQIHKVYLARKASKQQKKDDAWRRERGLIP